MIMMFAIIPADSSPLQLNVVKLPSLYWSVNNRLFSDASKLENNYYLKLNAHLGDSIDLICPRTATNGSAASTAENTNDYSIIYKVSSKHEFDNCIINPNNYETVPILKCDKPNAANLIKFTIYFVKYSPVPNALEFEEDKEYYFLSTSSGTRDGINYMSGGLCSKFNMRFSIKINSPSGSGASSSSSPASNGKNVSSLLFNKLSKNGDEENNNDDDASLVGDEDDNADDQQRQQQLNYDDDANGDYSGVERNRYVSTRKQSDQYKNDKLKQPHVSKLNLVVSKSWSLSRSSPTLPVYLIATFLTVYISSRIFV